MRAALRAFLSGRRPLGPLRLLWSGEDVRIIGILIPKNKCIFSGSRDRGRLVRIERMSGLVSSAVPPKQLRSRQTLDRLLDAARGRHPRGGHLRADGRQGGQAGAVLRRSVLPAVPGQGRSSLRHCRNAITPKPYRSTTRNWLGFERRHASLEETLGQALLPARAHGPEGRASASCIRDPGGHLAGLPRGGPEVLCLLPLHDDPGAAFISGRDPTPGAGTGGGDGMPNVAGV